jgi:hypothetical protein
MISCPKCGRHHKLDETACPFCRSKSSAKSVIGLAMTTVLTPVVLAACYGMGGYKDYCADTGNPDGIPCSDTGVETDADGTGDSDDTGSSGDSDDTGSSGDSDDTGSSGDSDDTGSSGDSDDTGSSGDSDDTGSSGDSDDTGSPTEEDMSTVESEVPMDADFPECATGDDLAAR